MPAAMMVRALGDTYRAQAMSLQELRGLHHALCDRDNNKRYQQTADPSVATTIDLLRYDHLLHS